MCYLRLTKNFILKSELFQIEDEIKNCIESKKDDYAIRSIVDKHKYLAGSLEDLGVDFKHLFKKQPNRNPLIQQKKLDKIYVNGHLKY